MTRRRRIAGCVIATIFAAASAVAAAPSEPDPNSAPATKAAKVHIARMVSPSARPLPFSIMQNGAAIPQCLDNNGNVTACDGATMLQFNYYDGKVIPNAKVYAVFWTSAVDGMTQSSIGGFYDGITNSGWMDWMAEYSTSLLAGGSNQIVGRGTWAGAYTITPAATTPHTCAVSSNGKTPSSGTVCIWDTDIPLELDAQITAGNVPPPDQHTIYMFHFPKSYAIQSFDRTNISDSCVEYCAFHGTYTRLGYGSVYYSVLPDPGAHGCQSGCGAGTTFQNLCSAAAHELGEAMSDAEVGLADIVGPPLGWYDGALVSQGEIGDMCNQATDTFTALSGNTYTRQTMFSRALWNALPQATTQACVSSRFETNDYQLFFYPNTQSLAGCGTATIPIHLETTNGAASAVTLAISSLSAVPPGVHVSLSQTSVVSGAGTVANLDISVDAGAAPAKDQVIVVNATSGTLVHSAAVLLQVTTAPSVSSNSPVCAGSPINLSTPMVTGATYAWTGPNGFTSTLPSPSIANPTAAAFGTYSVVVTVNGCSSTPGSVTVSRNLSPSVGLYPTSFIAAGATKGITPSSHPVDFSITATASAGFTGSLSVDGSTGVVTVSNAGPANTSPTITVTASDHCGAIASTTFALAIDSFTNDPLVAGVTQVKAAHITELRTAVRLAAALVGQTPVFTDDPLSAGTKIKAIHITELRTALNSAFTALHLTPPSFTDPTLTLGVTPLRAVHVQELRNALQ